MPAFNVVPLINFHVRFLSRGVSRFSHFLIFPFVSSPPPPKFAKFVKLFTLIIFLKDSVLFSTMVLLLGSLTASFPVVFTCPSHLGTVSLGGCVQTEEPRCLGRRPWLQWLVCGGD